MIKNIEVIEKTLQLEQGTIKKALEAQEEVELTIPELLVFKKDEYDTRIKNITTEKYNEGKIAGVEMQIKEARDKFGLKFEGKTFDNFINAFKDKTLEEAKIEPNQKIKEYENTIEGLRTNLSKAEQEKNDILNNLKRKEQEDFINNTLMSSIDEKVSTSGLTKSDVATLFKSNYQIEVEDNKVLVKKNGTLLKNDKTFEPLPVKDVMDSFINERKFIKIEGGNGASDSGSQIKAGTLEAFNEEMTKKGHPYGTDVYFKEMAERLKNKTLRV